MQKVLNTKAVYESQTGLVVANEIESILEEFSLNEKVGAATVDNASNMDVALKTLKFLKVGCFAHTLNLAAQKVYSIGAIRKWCAKHRAVVVWLKRSTMAKTVLQRSAFNPIRTRPCSLVVDEAGQPRHIICTFRDVSLCTGFINIIREGFLLCRTHN